ncbi:MAG: amidohydrolase family protein [Methanosphaera sp.]|uniref:amidohydrolase family protein n=1 Tax=Methanosphaera sp. TaxID=2666342 RepID=UPI0025FDE553|nr:amidohydrolase family protein [Methanosphaera sp.]MCI5867566.1 amidohydrolase family protein [Methanosphaera sp.]MDD6534033.1 amidohydrolase family protein [Methanosphaera sp.]MDY3956157.1 amidohydrolase family protein [Methanosphaera sp.]
MTETTSILIKDPITIADEIKKQSILIVDNKIQEVGTNLENGDAEVVIDASDKIAAPALINTHTHVAMTLLRGVGGDVDLQDWLNNYIWPREANLTDELVYAGSKLAMAEMIKTGTVMFNDMYFNMEQTAKATDEVGMRATLGYGMIDLFDDEKRKQELKEAKKLIDSTHNTADGRIKVAVTPHAPNTCSGELISDAAKLAKDNNVKLHIHVAETKDEVEMIKDQHGMTPFEYLDSLNALSSDMIAAHGVWTTDDEIKTLAQRGVTISHNPSSNMKLASGIAPVAKYLEGGVNVTIGTDGVASNNNLDMFSEMKLTALLQKVDTLDPKVANTKEVFDMATVNAANALGINSGEIKEGKLADIMLIDANVPHMVPMIDVMSNIIYSSLNDVNTVICDGKILLQDKELQTINEAEIMKDVKVAAKEL